MRADIVPGGIFPDYELPDHTTKRRKLSELQGEDPMVLVLSRGGFCPRDRRQHEGLVQLYRELEVGYCHLVTISTDNITETNEYRSGVGAQWPFLSDAGRRIQKDLDIAEYTDPLHNPMIPHTIVLEPGLAIYKIYMGYWFFGRPTVEELRQDLRVVLKKCRPDWDINTTELKAAWAAGRKELSPNRIRSGVITSQRTRGKKMIEEINQQRRRFISAAAMTIAAARLGLVGSEQVQADETRPPAQPAIRPETNTSFAALKDHAPTPTISRKIDPSSTAKSVRASCAMLQKPYEGSLLTQITRFMWSLRLVH
jgi:peroxiredoxin